MQQLKSFTGMSIEFQRVTPLPGLTFSIFRVIPEQAHNFNVTINVLLPDNSFSVSSITFRCQLILRSTTCVAVDIPRVICSIY